MFQKLFCLVGRHRWRQWIDTKENMGFQYRYRVCSVCGARENDKISIR